MYQYQKGSSSLESDNCLAGNCWSTLNSLQVMKLIATLHQTWHEIGWIAKWCLWYQCWIKIGHCLPTEIIWGVVDKLLWSSLVWWSGKWTSLKWVSTRIVIQVYMLYYLHQFIALIVEGHTVHRLAWWVGCGVWAGSGFGERRHSEGSTQSPNHIWMENEL